MSSRFLRFTFFQLTRVSFWSRSYSREDIDEWLWSIFTCGAEASAQPTVWKLQNFTLFSKNSVKSTFLLHFSCSKVFSRDILCQSKFSFLPHCGTAFLKKGDSSVVVVVRVQRMILRLYSVLSFVYNFLHTHRVAI